MEEQNVNLDYCGIINLLQQLVKLGKCTETEMKKIAARIAAECGANIVISF